MEGFTKYLICFCCLLGVSASVLAQLHHRDKPLPCLNKTFYIHTHVVLDAQRDPGPVDKIRLDSVLALASEYFAPVCVQFKACEFDTILNYNYAVIKEQGREGREMVVKFQEHNRINMYLLDGISNACSYSNNGSIQNPKNAALFITKGFCLNPRLLAHELGHLFGLLHTYHDRYAEFVDGSNCLTEGDRICDTPADPFTSSDTLRNYVTGCEFIHTFRDPNGQFYQPLVGNIMSAFPGRCDCGFTYDQLELMANNYLNSTMKIW